MARGQIQANVDAAALGALVVYRNEVGPEAQTPADSRDAAEDAAAWLMEQNLVAETRGSVELIDQARSGASRRSRNHRAVRSSPVS